jgi:hypothetical protein
MEQPQLEEEAAQADSESKRDPWLLSQRERWLFALPFFAWLVLSAVYPLLVNTLLDPIVATTPWRDLPLATQRVLAISQFVGCHQWKFCVVAFALVWAYFRWISRNRANVYLLDLILVISLGAVLWRTYQGLSAAGWSHLPWYGRTSVGSVATARMFTCWTLSLLSPWVQCFGERTRD